MNVLPDRASIDSAVQLAEIQEKMIEGLRTRDLTLASDVDGTLDHDKPGEHRDVQSNYRVTRVFNAYNIATNGQAFPLTGRPFEYAKNKFSGRNFMVGIEHGLGVSFAEGHDPTYWLNRTAQIDLFKTHFDEARSSSDLLSRVQIEGYKEATATLGFTHIINPEGRASLTDQMAEKMQQLKDEVCARAEKILRTIGADDLEVKPTVTPTNAVIEILPRDVCKATSFQYLRDKLCLRTTAMNVFCGDSDGDKSLMDKIAREEGGVCLGVGPKAPQSAHVVFETPNDLIGFLEDTISRVRPDLML